MGRYCFLPFNRKFFRDWEGYMNIITTSATITIAMPINSLRCWQRSEIDPFTV
ncbi:MAG: hypothetical protein DDT26_01756 [Dehalococcoidia bacterium]|nr:hypothetical protein [Chloroflexota bacterium]